MEEKGFFQRLNEKLISKLTKSAWRIYTQSQDWFGKKFAGNTLLNLLGNYFGIELDGKSLKLDVIFQTVKRIETHLAKLMESSNLDYDYFRQYKLEKPLGKIEMGMIAYDALKYYGKNVDESKTFDEIKRELNISKLIEEKGEAYTTVFV
jgi:hypothetical protein